MEAKFDLWCIVELFGHNRIAGRCTEQNVAGVNMLRVDVPATSGSEHMLCASVNSRKLIK